MTFGEALAQIGVEPDIDAKELRRAYLRAVKLHPPERDAEGFRRVREAYELLQVELGMRQAMAGDGVVVDSMPVSTSLQLEIPENDALEPPDADAEETGSWRQQFDPASADEDEEAEPLEVGDAAAYAWLERGRPVEAERTLVRQLAAHREYGARPPSGHVVVQTLLTLLSKGKRHAFAKLLRETRAWLDGFGHPEQFAGETVAVWALLDELDGVRRRLDPELVRLIATAMLDWDVVKQDAALSSYRKAKPRSAAAAARLLEAKAPGLYKQFGGALARDAKAKLRPQPENRGRGGMTWPVWILLMVGINIARVCAEDKPTNASRPVTARQLAVAPPYVPDAATTEFRAARLSVEAALQRHDCVAARASVTRAYPKLGSRNQAREMDELARRVDDECSSSLEGGP